jgi:hypothetical protein
MIDYRYIEHGAALAYLDEKIEEGLVDAVTARLKSTKRKIVRSLGER